MLGLRLVDFDPELPAIGPAHPHPIGSKVPDTGWLIPANFNILRSSRAPSSTYAGRGCARAHLRGSGMSWIEAQSTAVIALFMFSLVYVLAATVFGLAVTVSRRSVAQDLKAVAPVTLQPVG